MELRHIRYFLAVAEEGNFTRAAARLGIGQPPLSQQIRDLETEIGAMLFHRVPHGAELTVAGTAFLPEAKASLAAAEKARLAAQSANRGETGRLSLGFTASSAFNSLVSTTIRRFRARWPEVRLSLTEMNTLGLMQKLERGELDATFMRPGLSDPDGIRLKRLPDDGVRAHAFDVYDEADATGVFFEAGVVESLGGRTTRFGIHKEVLVIGYTKP